VIAQSAHDGAKRFRQSGLRRVSDPIDIAGLTGAQIVALAKQHLPRGHGAARSIYRAAMGHGRFDPEQHGLGAQACTAWRNHFRLTLPEVAKVLDEETTVGTTSKIVLRLGDGLSCECVVLPKGRGRATLCISSQVGCKMGCTFCETGRMGLLRNMTTAEIVAQILVARHVLGYVFQNVVFMGMGEALDNAEAVLPALRVLCEPGGLAIAQERITVCTVGRVDGIAQLMEAGFRRLNLSVSLNAPTDELRAAMMPIARKTRLADLQEALRCYRPRPNFALGVNYCLLPGINDAREHATGVARFCEPLGRVMVNVIGYNPGTLPLTRSPSDDEIDRFIGFLREDGLAVRLRMTKGRSVMAACGQLGDVELRRTRTPTLHKISSGPH